MHVPKLTGTEMAPYLQLINSDRSDLINKLLEKNKAHLEEIDTKLKEAITNEGDSEISEQLRARAMYYCRIGDKVSELKVRRTGADEQEKALPAIDEAFGKTAGVGGRIDLVMAKVRLGLFSFDTTLVTENITKALE
jgi:26S proteasome regulatory subunit N7